MINRQLIVGDLIISKDFTSNTSRHYVVCKVVNIDYAQTPMVHVVCMSETFDSVLCKVYKNPKVVRKYELAKVEKHWHLLSPEIVQNLINMIAGEFKQLKELADGANP